MADKHKWFKGVIDRENSDGTFNIKDEDDDRERDVKRDSFGRRPQ